MRDIKFRGLTTKGEMVEGSLVTTNAFIKHKPKQHTKHWIVTSAFGNGGWFNVRCRTYVKPETVGQFTGLQDKNGVDIYEGDILKMYHQDMYLSCHVESTVSEFEMTGHNAAVCIGEMPDIRTVAWCKGALMLNCRDGGHGHYKSFNDLANPGESFVVIGNIHENPELLK